MRVAFPESLSNPLNIRQINLRGSDALPREVTKNYLAPLS